MCKQNPLTGTHHGISQSLSVKLMPGMPTKVSYTFSYTKSPRCCLLKLGRYHPENNANAMVSCSTNPYHPWDWYIYLHEWLILMVNVGKYTSPMDAMGKIMYRFIKGPQKKLRRYFCCIFVEVGFQYNWVGLGGLY